MECKNSFIFFLITQKIPDDSDVLPSKIDRQFHLVSSSNVRFQMDVSWRFYELIYFTGSLIRMKMKVPHKIKLGRLTMKIGATLALSLLVDCPDYYRM